MGKDLLAWLPSAQIDALLAIPHGEALLAALFFLAAVTTHASGIPGTLMPMSFTSGALLGGALGIAAVATGTLIGGQILYLLLARGSEATLRQKYGHRLQKLDALASKRGLASMAGLRLAGAPHLLVTVLCALAAFGPRRYAVATLIGLLPAISLSALAGSAL